jgi:CheY-like chemotaxis protein
LLDIMMPRETGWDLIERLAREPLLVDIPIKFISASPVAIEAYRRAGGARISLLPKPSISRDFFLPREHTASAEEPAPRHDDATDAMAPNLNPAPG